MESLTADQWAAVNERILACDVLGALQAIRTACECGLNDAKDVHIRRYRELRDRRPVEFMCSHEQYWSGVYG